MFRIGKKTMAGARPLHVSQTPPHPQPPLASRPPKTDPYAAPSRRHCSSCMLGRSGRCPLQRYGDGVISTKAQPALIWAPRQLLRVIQDGGLQLASPCVVVQDAREASGVDVLCVCEPGGEVRRSLAWNCRQRRRVGTY